jgi:hypothetical protein
MACGFYAIFLPRVFSSCPRVSLWTPFCVPCSASPSVEQCDRPHCMFYQCVWIFPRHPPSLRYVKVHLSSEKAFRVGRSLCHRWIRGLCLIGDWVLWLPDTWLCPKVVLCPPGLRTRFLMNWQCETKKKRSWGHGEILAPVQELQDMVDGIHIICTFIKRRVQPLQTRAWYIANVSIIFDTPCLFYTNSYMFCLHFVVLLYNFRH